MRRLSRRRVRLKDGAKMSINGEKLLEVFDGQKVGRDPREIAADDFSAAGIEASPVLSAIRAKCIDCSGDSRSEVAKCTAVACALWPFRMGTNPFRLKREEGELSDAQRAARAAFGERARVRRAGAANSDAETDIDFLK